MARYVDADAMSIYFDALIKHAETEGLYNMAHVYERCLRIVKDAPTADVAPMAEVAREIFEKIRNILNKHYYACYQNEDGDECDAVISYLSYVAVDFDRLEQKYTGAEPEPPKGGNHE